MRSLLEKLIRERVVMGVIVLNALVLFLQGFDAFPTYLRRTLYWTDYGCTVFFVVEITTKISFWGWSTFWSKGWNRFDFAVVAISLPFLLAPLPYVSIKEFGSILILRLGRLFRLFRSFQFIPNQAEIWSGITRALRASIGVFLALFLYVLTLSLFSYYLFDTHAPKYFGDPLLSLYSMFQIFTVEGWYEIPNQIAAGSGWPLKFLARAYFAFTVLTGGILGLSLANAVFVDEMVMDNTQPLEEDVDALRTQLSAYMERSNDHRQEMEALLRDLHDKIETDGPDDS